MESTAKSFEKALAFHLGIIYNNGVSLAPAPDSVTRLSVDPALLPGERVRSPHAHSPTAATDRAAAVRQTSLLEQAGSGGGGDGDGGVAAIDSEHERLQRGPHQVRSGSPVDAMVTTGACCRGGNRTMQYYCGISASRNVV